MWRLSSQVACIATVTALARTVYFTVHVLCLAYFHLRSHVPFTLISDGTVYPDCTSHMAPSCYLVCAFIFLHAFLFAHALYGPRAITPHRYFSLDLLSASVSRLVSRFAFYGLPFVFTHRYDTSPTRIRLRENCQYATASREFK